MHDVQLTEEDLNIMAVNVRDYLTKRGQPERIEEFNQRLEQSDDLHASFKLCDKYFPNYLRGYVQMKRRERDRA